MRATFRENGIGIIEAAIAWTSGINNFTGHVEVEGLDFLEAAQNEGNGVLLIGAHYSTLEMGGALLARYTDYIDYVLNSTLSDDYWKKL